MADAPLPPIEPPDTCQHPSCGRAIRFAPPWSWEHVDGRGGHVVDLGAEYKAAQQARFEAVKAAALDRASR